MPCGKRCYSRREAGEVINFAHSRLHGKRTWARRRKKAVPVRIYWCGECGAYHVTHYRRNPGGKNS